MAYYLQHHSYDMAMSSEDATRLMPSYARVMHSTLAAPCTLPGPTAFAGTTCGNRPACKNTKKEDKGKEDGGKEEAEEAEGGSKARIST